MLPHLWQRRFHCTINVCGVPAKLCLWKISSLHYIWCFYLKISFFMEINLQESADWFKLMNEIPNLWGNIILCEKCLFCINFICLMTIVSESIWPLWYRTSYKQHTFSAIRYQKRKMPWIRGWFHDKILAELLKTFNHKKSHTNLETNIMSNERNFWKRWILSPKITALKHNENDFFRQHLPCEY